MISINKKFNKKKGFTLVEVIASLAIIGIISIAFLSMFGFGIKNIIMSGKNSSSNFNAQAILESNISDASTTSAAITRTSTSIKLYKSNVLYTTIDGNNIQVTYPYSNSTKTLTTFISD
jgi:prepilin-type N-terminal cleavage/methylation domain-containing protein